MVLLLILNNRKTNKIEQIHRLLAQKGLNVIMLRLFYSISRKFCHISLILHYTETYATDRRLLPFRNTALTFRSNVTIRFIIKMRFRLVSTVKSSPHQTHTENCFL